jgi:hypothetical protein
MKPACRSTSGAVLLERRRAAPRRHWTWPGCERHGAGRWLTESADITVALPHWVLAVQRASGRLTIRDRAGRLLVDGIAPHSGRKPLMAEALRAKQSGLWLASTLPRLEEAVVTLERQDGAIVVAVSGRYPLPADARQQPDAPAAGAPQRFDDLLPGAAAAARTAAGDAAAAHVSGAGRPAGRLPAGDRGQWRHRGQLRVCARACRRPACPRRA